MVKEPVPLITPLKVELVVASAKNVPPPALSVIALLEVIPARASSVPPLKLRAPVPRLLSLLTARVPGARF
jgi:hypothetical protein